MSAFSDTEHNTTPWLKDQKSNSNFILYKNAYSSWGGTVPALERALTEKNQYNNKEFNQSITIIDIAKKLVIIPVGSAIKDLLTLLILQ